MHLRFNTDPETGLPHIYDHGVREEEVEQVMRRSSGVVRRGRGNSKVKFGQTDAGRYLAVVYIPDDEAESVFIVTAYELRGKPLKAYRRHKRRRHS